MGYDFRESSMCENIIKPVRDITRDEWITYRWIDITSMGDKDRMLLMGFMRTPEEGKHASLEWDIWIDSVKIATKEI